MTDGCPEGLVCHTKAGYARLGAIIAKLADYAVDAWQSCREQPGEGETDHE